MSLEALEKRVREQFAAEMLAQHLVASLKEAHPHRQGWEELDERDKCAWLYATGRLISFQVDGLMLAFEDFDITPKAKP